MKVVVTCQRCDRHMRPIDVIPRDVPIPAFPTSAMDAWPASAPVPGPPLAELLERSATPYALTATSATPEPSATAKPPDAPAPSGPDAPVVPSPRRPLESPSRHARTVLAPRPASRNQTSVLALSEAATRALGAAQRRARLKVFVIVLATVTPQLLLAMVFTSGAARMVLGALTFLAVAVLLGWGSLTLMPRLAQRYGARVLPGGPWVWLGSGAIALTLVAALLTWGLVQSAAPVAAAVGMPVPEVREVPAAPSASTAPPARTDQKLARTGHVQVGPGVMHVPPSFESLDGSFDLYLHLHGNTQLVEKSADAVGLNAVVHVTNLGVASDKYAEHFVVPGAFDGLVTRIERKLEKLGLEHARARRIAVGSWSAGFGAVYRILQAKGAPERIDALLMLDGMHIGFYDEKAGAADPMMLEPYSRFAREAAAGRKLMVLTHSEVKPVKYASSSETADLLLGVVGAERHAVDPETGSPPKVEFAEAVKAFPRDAQRWLRAKSSAHVGNLHVLGFEGATPEDHMAHLIQMSVTALPLLAERWRSAPGDE